MNTTLTDKEASVVGDGDSKEEYYFESATHFDLMDSQIELGYYHVQTLRALIKQVCNSQRNWPHGLIMWNAERRVRLMPQHNDQANCVSYVLYCENNEA